MKLAKYRAIDLLILTVIMIVLETVCVMGISRFDSIFVISVTTIVSLIIMMRWSAWGLIPSVLGGGYFAYFINAILGGVTFAYPEVIIYAVGSLGLSVLLIYFKFVGKDRITQGGWFLVLYALIGFLAVCLTRSVVAVCFGKNFILYLKNQLIAETLNFVFAIIILFITNKQENILRDQKDYLSEVSSGGKNER